MLNDPEWGRRETMTAVPIASTPALPHIGPSQHQRQASTMV